MSLPWHVPLESAPNLKPLPEEPKTGLQQHYCGLNIHKNPSEELQMGLMCDIGENNKDFSIIQRLLASGMTISRINIHGLDRDASLQLIQSIRQAVYNYSAELEYIYPLALIVEIRAPDIMIGNLKGGHRSTVEIIQGQNLRLTTDISWRESGTADCLFINYEHLSDLNPGDFIFIDSLNNSQLKITVLEVGEDAIECCAITGGIIGPKMAVRISQVPIDKEHKTYDQDDKASEPGSEICESHFETIEQQIDWAVASDIDALLLPNTKNSHYVRNVRDILGEKGKHILVFASIESVLGLDNIDEILAISDGLYLDRYLLSTDLPVEKIFVAQKLILSKCNAAGKPCICKAVINEKIPTLCITDIANLVLDGADVLFLEMDYDSPLKKLSSSYDTFRMAEHCVSAAAVVCRNAEQIVWQPGVSVLENSLIYDPTKAVSISAVELSIRSKATAIICLTSSGRTAKTISQYRPVCPIIAVTRACHTARQMRFWKGIRTLHYFEAVKNNWNSEVESRVHAALDYCKAKHILKAGDPYVVMTGTRRGVGFCDSIRLLYASARDLVF